MAKRRCLEARGWRVLSVPGHEWRQLPSQEAQVGRRASRSRGLGGGYGLQRMLAVVLGGRLRGKGYGGVWAEACSRGKP